MRKSEAAHASLNGAVPRSSLVAVVRRTLIVLTLTLAMGFPIAVVQASSSSAAPFALRINSGGGAFSDSAGNDWSSDRYYSGGNTASTTRAISGTTDDALYQTERWGLSGYQIPVPSSGNYQVTLHFDEFYLSGPGQRVFSIDAESDTFVNRLDIFAAAGGRDRAHQISRTIAVTDGSLDLSFSAITEDPKINGIEITGAGGQPPPPPPPNPPPPSNGFPGAAATGVPTGTTLAPSGGLRVSTPNAVIDAKDITGSVTVAAPGVIIKRSRIHGSGIWGVYVESGSVRVEDSEIYGNYTAAAVGFNNWTVIRCDIHDVPDDGVKLGSNTLLQDSWLHDFAPGRGSHADGAQLQSGERNVVVRHNTINLPGTNAALFLAPDLGPSTDGPLLVENNLLGGGNYTVFCVDGNNGQYFVSNITIRNNRFLRNASYGAARVNVTVAWSGNVYDDSGATVSAR